MSSTVDTEIEVAPAPTEVERELANVVERFRETLGDDLVQSHIEKNDLWIRVATPAWHATIERAKHLGYTYFCFLSGLDWLPNNDLGGEKVFNMGDAAVEGEEAEESTLDNTMKSGYAGGVTRFQVFVRLYDIERHVGITIKADVQEPALEIASIQDIYAGADWHERECWEMYGVIFMGHPGLRHLYLPGEFEGFPLRKDFPLLAREVKPWPGIVDVEPMPASVDGVEDGAGADDAAEGEGE